MTETLTATPGMKNFNEAIAALQLANPDKSSWLEGLVKYVEGVHEMVNNPNSKNIAAERMGLSFFLGAMSGAKILQIQKDLEWHMRTESEYRETFLALALQE